ncbi:testican-2 isoform X2 [Tamandua tetradactyla]|uniref:testican-2 isoform X2 n=1 Tax=Tamandua tetradactyla TaxID=48850 RepID=UPI004053C144
MCISRKKLEHRIKQPTLKLHGNKDAVCKPCHMAQLASVCGSDGHTYSSVCKLEQQACLSSKQLSVRCEGPCPCPTEQATSSSTDGKPETCTGQDLADLGDRLRDWFQLLHENSKQNGSASSGASPASGLDKSLGASCKDSIGWMFSKLDTSADLFLDQMELAAINLDKYEVCIRPFFNSCDTYKDGRVSTAEWCFCFWREKPPCLAELERIQIQEAAKKKPGHASPGPAVTLLDHVPSGVFIPSCDEDGYYRKMQCDQSSGDCWCVDQLGLELTGTRLHGSPDCDDLVGFSGDFGSGVGWEDEEEKETEEAGEEAEEEEGEAGEADDGGYIWYSEKEGLQYWTSPGRLPGGMRLKLNSKIGSTRDKIPRGGTTSMRPSAGEPLLWSLSRPSIGVISFTPCPVDFGLYVPMVTPAAFF